MQRLETNFHFLGRIERTILRSACVTNCSRTVRTHNWCTPCDEHQQLEARCGAHTNNVWNLCHSLRAQNSYSKPQRAAVNRGRLSLRRPARMHRQSCTLRPSCMFRRNCLDETASTALSNEAHTCGWIACQLDDSVTGWWVASMHSHAFPANHVRDPNASCMNGNYTTL